MSFTGMMLVAMALDLVLGWPDGLYRRIGHPVTWIGAVISGLERRWNIGPAPRRKLAGVAILLVVAGGSGLLAWAVQTVLPGGVWGVLIGGALAWPLVALRSMHDHVMAVVRPLEAGDLPAARHAVSMIVGRDPNRLDRAGVTRAALESLAENTSDGIVAPLLWGALLGLPGIAAYKAVNTLDSMIGHRTERYQQVGWASARFDDLVNLAPARLTGVLFALVSDRTRHALRIMWRDAGQHRSPNAGWPEAAMAGALRVRLSGPRAYAATVTDEPWVNGDDPDPVVPDLRRALALYRWALIGLAAGFAGMMLV